MAGSGYISSNQSVPTNTPLLFGIAATAGDGELNRFIVSRIFKNITIIVKDTLLSTSVFYYFLHASSQGTDGTENWAFTIFDKNGSTSTANLTITTLFVNGPTIHFIVGSGYTYTYRIVPTNTPLLFGIAATAGDGKLKRFLVQRTFKGNTITQKDSSFSATSFNYDLHTVAMGTDGTETWVFTIFDINGLFSQDTLTIITTIPQSGLIFTYSTKVLGAQTSTSGSFFASSSGTIYFLLDAKINAALVDWVYFYGASNLATIWAPSDPDAAVVFDDPTNGVSTWSVRNATVFKLFLVEV
jgi:hypothetical protein